MTAAPKTLKSRKTPNAAVTAGAADCSAKIRYYKRRLAAHRRRLKYWSGNPSFTGYGPTGEKLSTSHMDMEYEIAVCDARSIASELARLGVNERVVDVRETFRHRWTNPKAPDVLIWPNGDSSDRRGNAK